MERRNPRSPLLGHWRARLAQLERAIGEINDALAQEAAGMPAVRPRAGQVPRDGDLPPVEGPIPVVRYMRIRRRLAAQKAGSGFPRASTKESSPVEPVAKMDTPTRGHALALMEEIEATGAGVSLEALAARVGVREVSLRLDAHLCERLERHNARCKETLQQRLSARLQELRERREEADYDEFARLCGMVRRQLYTDYPDWCTRLAEHNREVRQSRTRELALQRLDQVIAAGMGLPIRTLAREVGMDTQRLRRDFPDIAERLVHHNRAMGLHGSHRPRDGQIASIQARLEEAQRDGVHLTLVELTERCHLTPDTIRRLCPELAAQLRKAPRAQRQRADRALAAAVAAVEASQEIWEVGTFAAAAGMTHGNLRARYPDCHGRLLAHNRSVVEGRLQRAWYAMQKAESVWTLDQFATAAGIDHATLLRSHPEWADRVKQRRRVLNGPGVGERIRTAVDEALRSPTLMTPLDVAKRAGVAYTTLLRSYPDAYERVLSHAHVAFRPRVDAAWEELSASNERPKLDELLRRSGIRSRPALRAYFPDILEKIRTWTNGGGG